MGVSFMKKPRYSAKIVEVAPRDAARITASSVQPNRNAGNGPKLSSNHAKIPPDRGRAPASSAIVSAPLSAIRPPNTQAISTAPGAWSCEATLAGTRKIPLPMVTPTRTATAPSSPTVRGSRSPQGSPALPSWGLFSGIRYCCRLAHIGLEGRLRPDAISTTPLGGIEGGIRPLQHGAGSVPPRYRGSGANTTGDAAFVGEPARSVDFPDAVAETLRGRIRFRQFRGG